MGVTVFSQPANTPNNGEISANNGGVFSSFFRSGRYYSPIFGTTTTSVAISTNFIYYIPFSIDEHTNFSAIAINCTTASSSTTCRLGIYKNANGIPGELVLDAGTVSVSTTGTKEILTNFSLSPGKYWLALTSTWSVSLSACTSTTTFTAAILGNTNISFANGAMAVGTFAGAELPLIAPTPTQNYNSSAITFWLKVA